MEPNIRKWIQRQTVKEAKENNKINVTIAVDDASTRNHKTAKPNYGHVRRRSAQDPDKDLIKEIVREVVSEVMAQTKNQHNCENCPHRTKATKGKRAEDPRSFNFSTLKPNGSIEHR